MVRMNLLNVISKYSRNGNKITKKISGDSIYVSYQNKSNHRIVSFTVPKFITLNKEFFESLGLAIGDGLNNPSIFNPHFNFVNTDFILVKKVYEC
ncbi:hypothetical protein J4482_03220 [Candidatus Woesearchaeota archaeon]|nr:hypothetical protein [Candidatus Woesearchaeota archaeon]